MGKGERHLLLNGIKTLLCWPVLYQVWRCQGGRQFKIHSVSAKKVIFSDVKTKKSDLSRSVPLGAHSVPCINERKNSILCSKKKIFFPLKVGTIQVPRI